MVEKGITLLRLDAVEATQHLSSLVALLRDAVEDGASVGFLSPLHISVAQDYWLTKISEIEAGGRILLAALREGVVLGTVQLLLESQPNGTHRCEVQRLLVQREVRRQGVGRALMEFAESVARREGRLLLILNTRRGGPPVRLYESLGYIAVGDIPDFARDPDGAFNTTRVFYRQLG